MVASIQFLQIFMVDNHSLVYKRLEIALVRKVTSSVLEIFSIYLVYNPAASHVEF